MSVGAVDGSTAGSGVSTPSTASGLTGFDQDMFLKLFVAQLRQQSPFDPVSSQDFINQVAQFSSVEAVQSMRLSLDAMRVQEGLAMGSALIGRQVVYTGPEGEEQVGLVEQVTQTDGSVFLQVDGSPVSLSDVRAVLPV